VLLGIDTVDEATASDTLNILLKYRTDLAKAEKELAAASK
jgi:hypothetical protein